MHSRIFIMQPIADGKNETELMNNIKNDLDKAGGSFWDETSLYESLRFADYVMNNKKFLIDDLQWLEHTYNIKINVAKINGESIGIIKHQQLKKLSNELKNSIANRIKNARKNIMKDHLTYADMYRISEILDPRMEFYFAIGNDLINEVGLYEYYIKDIKKNDAIIIIETYDYHY